MLSWTRIDWSITNERNLQNSRIKSLEDNKTVIRPTNGNLKQEIDLLSSYLVTLREKCGISPIVIQQANREQGNIERFKQGKSAFSINDAKDSGNTNKAQLLYKIKDFGNFYSDCLYKLKWCSLNSVKQGKADEAVPVLNPQEIEENDERLEVMPNEKDEAIKSSTKAGHCSE